MIKTTHFLVYLFIAITISACVKHIDQDFKKKGNVIFIHPDGTGLATWNALRLLHYGPDGELNWDKLSNIGLYRGHTKDCLTTSSNAGATMHAYGVKVPRASYGMYGDKELTALSGKKMSIMQEAMNAGIKTGIVNSGSIVEPGTGVFVASETSRSKDEEITKKIIESGADVILSGGEEWLLPEGEQGKFCTGKRKDGINLIDYAKQNGYKIVYNRKELLNIPNNIQKVLGVFAGHHMFNAVSEEEQAKDQLPHYNSNAPTLAEMTKKAIEILSQNDSQFFLIVEEEGTDNFGNHTNASGMLDALKRADDAIGVTLDFIDKNPSTLLITASDSEAGGMEVFGDPVDRMNPENPLLEFDRTGAQIDGINGTGTTPFISAPDQFGNSFPFAIIWSTHLDAYGSVVARTHGMNAELCKGSFDNTDVYRIMYLTLFGKSL